MPTVVYCWEMGGGYGHVGPFSPVAKRFVADGWRVVLIVRDLMRVPAFFEPGEVEVLQAPVKNSHPVPYLAQPATYGHMLLNMGIAMSTNWACRSKLGEICSRCCIRISSCLTTVPQPSWPPEEWRFDR